MVFQRTQQCSDKHVPTTGMWRMWLLDQLIKLLILQCFQLRDAIMSSSTCMACGVSVPLKHYTAQCCSSSWRKDECCFRGIVVGFCFFPPCSHAGLTFLWGWDSSWWKWQPQEAPSTAAVVVLRIAMFLRSLLISLKKWIKHLHNYEIWWNEAVYIFSSSYFCFLASLYFYVLLSIKPCASARHKLFFKTFFSVFQVSDILVPV